MKEIRGGKDDSITPREKKMYEKEYVHGAKLFQKALERYARSDNLYQKEEFKEVMDKAMNVLNETARELKAKYLAEQNAKIFEDYTAFTHHPTDTNAVDKLNQDLEKAKNLP